jgi:hypothetical protein
VTIFDVPKLDEETAWARVRATLAAHPLLEHVYDDTVIANLIRRRQSRTNYILFWLVLPADDERSIRFWSSITDDVAILERFGSLKLFRDKMQKEKRDEVESWRTELWFSAWLVRNGISLTLEPPMENKRPEFKTETEPPTWWEIKTPLDLERQRNERVVLTDVQSRLKEIPEPFVLGIIKADLALSDVPAAVKDIKKQIRSFAQSKGEPPATFKSGGLAVEVSVRTKHKSTGFLGTILTDGHMFQNEHASQIAGRIDSAIPQLPKGGAGIVVIDRTLSDWNDESDVIDACYGDDVGIVQGGKLLPAREEGFFRPGIGTRISAVVSYSRHPMHWEKEGGYEILFLHNSFAKVPLPEDLFRFPGVRHMRRVNLPDGCFRLEVTGKDITESDI